MTACAAESDGTPRGSTGAPTVNTAAGTSGGDPGVSGAGGGANTGAGAGSGGSGVVVDAGDPSLSTQDAPCAIAGTTRQCCGTGVQTCTGVEFPIWGPCVDGLGAEVVCTRCDTNEFGPGCDAGAAPDAGTPEPDAGTPTECGPGMECKPGAVRYCDMAGAEWSQSTCDATGHWPACVPATIPPAANGQGCAQNDYAPEMCCGPAMICCQDNPDGPFLDFGSGACAAVSCP